MQGIHGNKNFVMGLENQQLEVISLGKVLAPFSG